MQNKFDRFKVRKDDAQEHEQIGNQISKNNVSLRIKSKNLARHIIINYHLVHGPLCTSKNNAKTTNTPHMYKLQLDTTYIIALTNRAIINVGMFGQDSMWL